MRIDGISLREGSNISNLTVASGTSFPTSPNDAEMFYRTDSDTRVRGMYVYISGSWDRVASTDSLSAPNGASFPAAANTGDLFYLTSGAAGLYAYTGSAWVLGAGVTPPYVLKAGDTMTGNLTVTNAAPFAEVYRFSNDASGPSFVLGKTRGTVAGSLTAVTSGDTLGTVFFGGTDGATLLDTAAIKGQAEATFTTNVGPASLLFQTSTTVTSGLTTRLTINSAGNAIFTGTVTAPTFSGSLTGHASLDLPLTGGTLTGNLSVTSAAAGSPLISSAAVSGQTASLELAGNGNVVGTSGFLIRQSTDSRAFVMNRASADMVLGTGVVTALTLTSAGQSVFTTVAGAGSGAAQTSSRSASSYTPGVQITGTGTPSSSLLVARYSADVNAPVISLGKSRAAAVGTSTIVASGDGLGDIDFSGSDGTNFQNAARITVQVDGTPGAGSMPGRLMFLTTPTAAATPIERMRIDSGGVLYLSDQAYFTAQVVGGAAAGIQLASTNGNTNIQSIRYTTTQSNSPIFSMAKVANNTAGTFTAVATNDLLGVLKFSGADGTAITESGRISMAVNGTVSSGVVPADMAFSLQGSTRMTITSAGLVGIGTTPTQSLEVLGNVIARDSKTASTATNSRWFGGAYSSNPLTLAYVLGNSTGNSITIGGGTSGGESATLIAFNTASTVGTVGVGTERMRIDGVGNVGIGMAPAGSTVKLSISDGTIVTLAGYNYATNTISGFGTNSNHALGFLTNGAERMRIDTSGNVFIGSTALGCRLGVNGSTDAAGSFTAGTAAFRVGSNLTAGGNEIRMHTDATNQISYISAYNTGTSVVKLAFNLGVVTIDGAGNTIVNGTIGLGTTVSAWESGAKVIQLSNAGAGGTASDSGAIWARGDTIRTITGAYYNGTNYIYQATGVGLSSFTVGNAAASGFSWQSAVAGTAGGTVGTVTTTMTLDANGNLLIGTASTSGNAGIQLLPNSGGTGAAAMSINHITGTATATVFAFWNYNGTSIGSVSQSGTTAVLYNTTSDVRLKTNIVNASSAGAKIDALQVREYDFKTGDHVDYGFIAQELVTVAPEAVHVGDSDQTTVTDVWGVDYSKLVPMLVKELQELRARVAVLEAVKA